MNEAKPPKLPGPLDLEHYAVHLRLEIDRLLAVGNDYVRRVEDAEAANDPIAIGLRHEAARELEEIIRLLQRGQLALVHRKDARYAAAQNLLRATDGNARRTPLPAADRVQAA